jgi:hypothetical protein
MKVLSFSLLLLVCLPVRSQVLDSLLEVRGFCIAAPHADGLERFISFMENDLAKNGINTLILRVDYNYQYKSFPNLSDSNALSNEDVKRIVHTARNNKIRLIPQINLLGHQSWAESVNNLLRNYPQFDETPSVNMPDNYVWPNEDNLYCKSYCPLHPEVHSVVFPLIDEIIEVFEADAFHAGMDEVFYIGEDECPRCQGKDKAVLFAGEVNAIRDHLAFDNKEFWIWGDRLLDGKSTGLGMWEASENATFKAIDLIAKDVVICDWHYDRAEPSAPYFALKGFNVIYCSWDNAEVTKAQMEQMILYNQYSNNILSDRFLGVIQTIWSPAESFLDLYYGIETNEERRGPVESFHGMVKYLKDLE